MGIERSNSDSISPMLAGPAEAELASLALPPEKNPEASPAAEGKSDANENELGSVKNEDEGEAEAGAIRLELGELQGEVLFWVGVHAEIVIPITSTDNDRFD
ncbi:hypothetical protein EDD11_001557 [Mortierella claussenii]|nr:hypothetical protein EDD11_001557 [Mortierella claussenii]